MHILFNKGQGSGGKGVGIFSLTASLQMPELLSWVSLWWLDGEQKRMVQNRAQGHMLPTLFYKDPNPINISCPSICSGKHEETKR